ncbi:hypothetical protein ACGFZP_24025 [Kitasatospora sp. NPDC048239]|uniref:hypothetical protein n=1 Tax=Kitasatospora sp. NPDC048239 TaxID=3364046 RepID=UPI003716D56B
MTEDVVAVRLRLAEIVAKAETDDEYRQRLADEPGAVLAENNIPEGAVEQLSQDISRSRSSASLADESFDPTGCIHTDGCNDFTCIGSTCGPTCFVTIKIDAPDA